MSLYTFNWYVGDGETTRPDLFLHVYSLDGETIQRVYCRHSSSPRLRMIDGALYWLIDKEE